ncbi:uncharacterized protein LOC132186630 [Corylus avellana]|uniref:uncharacterized protein LOC132186630 n=1 Tax=Corylus avellana TaxID=13451 RepID=UPI00286C938F|nr:uncharacterized protein LOC132186630 [Corylus avellana]
MATIPKSIYHSERPIRAPVEGAHLNCSTADAGESGEQGRNTHSLLRDLFDMHEVRKDNCEHQVEVQGEEEHIVHDEVDECDVQKYEYLLKNADKPLHEKTKHKKLSATVHLYNLKYVGGVSNMIFLSFLNFMNQLLPVDDGALPIDTYEGNKDLDLCVKCGESKWNDEIHLDEDGQPITSSKRRLVKVLQWFLIIPQLQRLFMSQHTVPHMRWHANGRTKDCVLRHPVDGSSSPGMDIDVYLQPLIEELHKLWNIGVQTFDISLKKNFMLRAQLMWTINDFPAYENLSGWPTGGGKAYPCCMHATKFRRLEHENKFRFMGHRRYLPMDHAWRWNKRTFDGNQELECAPNMPGADEILKQLEEMVFGDESAEKNVMDNIIGTLLGIKGKTKDNLEARKDLQEMGLRPKLHLFTKDEIIYMPPAYHTMSNEDKN